MADFARWVVAAESAFGWPDGSFLRAYRGNRDAIHEIALDASMITAPLRTLLRTGDFEDTATELLDRLAATMNDAATHGKGWPGNPTALSRELARLAPNLRTVGIEVEKRREPRTGRRLIVIRTVPETPSPASPPEPAGAGTGPGGDASRPAQAPGVGGQHVHGDAGDDDDAFPRRLEHHDSTGWRCPMDRGSGHVPARRADGSMSCGTCHPGHGWAPTG